MPVTLLHNQPITVMDGVTLPDAFDDASGVGTDSFSPQGWLGFVAYVTATNAVQVATAVLQYSVDGSAWTTLAAASGGDLGAQLITNRDLSVQTGLVSASFGYADPAGIFQSFPSIHTRIRLLLTAANGGGSADVTGVTFTVKPIIDALGGVQLVHGSKVRIIDAATVPAGTVESSTFNPSGWLGFMLEGTASNTETLTAITPQFSLDGGASWTNGTSGAGILTAHQISFLASNLSALTARALVTTVMEGPITEHMRIMSGHSLCRMQFTNGAGADLTGFTVDLTPIMEAR